jgi:hypothetical protein
LRERARHAHRRLLRLHAFVCGYARQYCLLFSLHCAVAAGDRLGRCCERKRCRDERPERPKQAPAGAVAPNFRTHHHQDPKVPRKVPQLRRPALGAASSRRCASANNRCRELEQSHIDVSS